VGCGNLGGEYFFRIPAEGPAHACTLGLIICRRWRTTGRECEVTKDANIHNARNTLITVRVSALLGNRLGSDIDTAVYKLYDLTPDEIKLIEKTARSQPRLRGFSAQGT